MLKTLVVAPVSAFIILLFTPVAFAQTAGVQPPPTIPSGPSCFDHYTFGSVQVDMDPGVAATLTGVPLKFTGTVTNNNPYPIIDGAVYIKIFRLRKDSTDKNVNGPYVVDEFFAKDGISLPAHGSMPVSFSWNVPENAVGGDYEAAAFFTTSKKFNLLGLTFTDDITGNVAHFTVNDGASAAVEFNKDTVKVGDKDYFFAAAPPRVSGTDPVVIHATLNNPTNKDVTVGLNWRAYNWDAQKDDNLLDQQTSSVTIPANGTKDVTFAVKDNRHTVYLVEGTAQYLDTKSIINVRFVRDGISTIRLNFPSLETFPLRAGQEANLFSCFHNEADLTATGTVKLTLTDTSGNVIHDYSFTTPISGPMMATTDHFTPDRNYDSVILHAELYNGSNLVDQVDIPYNCKDIDPKLCFQANKTQDIVSIVAIVIGILVAGYLYMHVRNRQKVTPLTVNSN